MYVFEVYDYAEEGNSVAYDTHIFVSYADAEKALDWADHRQRDPQMFEVDSLDEIDLASNAGNVIIHSEGDWER